jgi:hypothetical protein
MMASEGREVGEVGKEQQLLRTQRVEQVTPSKTSDAVESPLHWRFVFGKGALAIHFINSGGSCCGFDWILGRRIQVESSRQYTKASDQYKDPKWVQLSHFCLSRQKKMTSTAEQCSWKVLGSELLRKVDWYVEYKRRYQQMVNLRTDGTVSSRSRWYYLWPRWLRPGGCKCACYPKNVESYYKDSEWENEDWSTSDEEGTIAAYTRESECLFFCLRKNRCQT